MSFTKIDVWRKRGMAVLYPPTRDADNPSGGTMGKRDAIRLLLETARALSREPDLDALFARLHELVARDFPCWSFIIALAEPDETMLRIAFYAEDGVRQPATDRVPV